MLADHGFPAAYFITFACYGNRLRGDFRGSVDLVHNILNTPYLPTSYRRVDANREQMTEPPYLLDAIRRELTLESIREVCAYRKWTLLAAHIRTTHVHAVVQANEDPERIMATLKAYASRKLNAAGIDGCIRKRWSRHGSTRYLWKAESIQAAIDYVVNQQGEPLEVFVDESP